MRQVFVSGATGFVGKSLVSRLSEAGCKVHALYRDPRKCDGLDLPGVALFRVEGLSDLDGMEKAMKGCDTAYHLAAYTSVRSRDTNRIYEHNVEGTRNVLDLARKHGLKRLVFTSTASVLGPSDGHPATESSDAPAKHYTHYERSKFMAEKLALSYIEEGPEVVVVNPSRIFGPGVLSAANSTTRLIRKYYRGHWRWIPGKGRSVGNYVYIDDVVEGLILAMDKGSAGQRYLLGGSNLSFNDFFRILAEVSGKQTRMVHVPFALMMLISGIFLLRAKLTGWSPPITPAFVRKYNQHWMISNHKAKDALGYQPHSFRDGLARTIDWMRHQDKQTETPQSP